MTYLKPLDFIQLKAFFLALQQSYFNLSQISSRVILEGLPTPIDKLHCLTLLRSFPDLQGEKFKDDNALIKHLAQPGNIQRILGQLPMDQQIELTKALVEKPAAVGVTGEQPGGQEAPVGQAVGEPVGTMAGGSPQMPNIPSARYSRPAPRIIRVTRAPEPSKPEILVANKSGVVAETPPSKIFIANKSGTVVGEHTVPPATSQKFNFRGFKTPDFVKNFSSNAQIFAKKNLGRIGGGLGDMVKGAGRGIGGPMLNSAYNGLGKVGNGLINAGSRLSNPGLRGITGRSLKSSGSKKLLWGLALGMFFFVFIGGIIGGITGTTPSGETAPISGSQPLTASLVSCPVSSNRITWPSYQLNSQTGIPTGHCTTDDEGKCPSVCPSTGRRAKSIDVDTSGGKDVVLPTILGQSAQWKFIQPLCAGAGTYPNCSAANGGTGGLYVFEGTIKGQTDIWSLQFIHMIVPSQLTPQETYTSGIIVGKTDMNIVHMTIGKNIKNPLGSGSIDTDCDPGWISADTGLGMCTTLSAAQPLENTYWFLLNRQKRYEILYKGTPEKISQSQVVKISPINPGSPGNEPTPLPQKLGKKFWSLTGEVRPHPQDSDPLGYEKFGPYFIVLNVPFKNQPDPSCNNAGTTDCYGPVPYIECGPNQDQQCNWHTEGEFGIHGNNKLDPPGSAGCVRHNNTDITEIYNTLSSTKAINSNTRYYVIDSDINQSSLTDENFAQELSK